MGKVSVAELRGQMKAIVERVEQGETFEITKRDKVVARLLPPPGLREGWAERQPQQAGRDALLHKIRSR